MLRNLWLVLLIVAAPAPLKIGADEPHKWSVIETPFFDLHYDPAYEGDARKVRERLDAAIESLNKEFAGHRADKLLQGFDCKLYLHSKPNDKASEGSALIVSGVSGDQYKAELHLLTPSAFRPGFKSNVGEQGGDDYFHKVLVHEYSTILLERITRAKKDGWRFFSAPGWFVQGYEEYLGLTLSSPHNRRVVLGKYLALHKADPGRVEIGFGVGIKDAYIDGAVLLHFMHETFGKERVQAILTSSAPTFEGAIRRTLDVTLEGFGKRWEDWRGKLP